MSEKDTDWELMEIPTEVEVARAIVTDAYDQEDWVHHLRGQTIQRVPLEDNYWDVYRVDPDGADKFLDTINIDAIASAQALLQLLEKYPGADTDKDPEQTDKEPEDLDRGPSMVY